MLDMNCGVYVIQGPNDREYVGSAVNIARRWKKHLQDLRAGRHHCKALQRAFVKYGEDAFTFAKLAMVAPAALIACEQSHMDARPRRLLYNSAPKAGSALGVKLSEATRAKMREIARQRSPETLRKIGDAHRGKTITAEHRSRLSALYKGNEANNERLRAMSRARNKCGFPGVSFDTRAGKWRASAWLDGKVCRTPGNFDTAQAASEARAAWLATSAVR